MTEVSRSHDLEVVIPADGAELAATLTHQDQPRPGVLLIGGTFSDLRDADPDPRLRPHIPPHGMFRVLAEALAAAGFAVLRFDRRGSGASTGATSERAQEIEDARAAWHWLAARPEVSSAFALVGESAGAYMVSRLTMTGESPAAVVLQGALRGTVRDLLAFNGRRARALYDEGGPTRDWLWQHARAEYINAVLTPAMLEALDRGRPTIVRASDERGSFERDLRTVAYDMAHPASGQLGAITCPTLVIHGGDDLNVPTPDALETTRTLWELGNRRVDLVILAGADHSMQLTPNDPEERVRERASFASFHRPFHPRYGRVISDFLLEVWDPAGRVT